MNIKLLKGLLGMYIVFIVWLFLIAFTHKQLGICFGEHSSEQAWLMILITLTSGYILYKSSRIYAEWIYR